MLSDISMRTRVRVWLAAIRTVLSMDVKQAIQAVGALRLELFGHWYLRQILETN